MAKRVSTKEFRKELKSKGKRDLKRYNLVYEFQYTTKMGTAVYRVILFYMDRDYRLLDYTWKMRDVIGVRYKDGYAKVYDEFIARLQLNFPELKVTRL